MRDKIIISTKSAARDKETVLKHIENSLRMMKTDYIDLFQFHQVTEVPDPNDPNGAYAAALEAKERGWIRHIGVTSHRVNIAEQCIASGWFETLQFPFSYISDERDLALADKCREADMGFIAMKGLAGGMLTNVRACHAFMKQYDNVVPIWGMQRMGGASPVARRRRGGSVHGRGAFRVHPQGASGAGRFLLPQLRLLHAMSRRYRNFQLQPA